MYKICFRNELHRIEGLLKKYFSKENTHIEEKFFMKKFLGESFGDISSLKHSKCLEHLYYLTVWGMMLFTYT